MFTVDNPYAWVGWLIGAFVCFASFFILMVTAMLVPWLGVRPSRHSAGGVPENHSTVACGGPSLLKTYAYAYLGYASVRIVIVVLTYMPFLENKRMGLGYYLVLVLSPELYFWTHVPVTSDIIMMHAIVLLISSVGWAAALTLIVYFLRCNSVGEVGKSIR